MRSCGLLLNLLGSGVLMLGVVSTVGCSTKEDDSTTGGGDSTAAEVSSGGGGVLTTGAPPTSGGPGMTTTPDDSGPEPTSGPSDDTGAGDDGVSFVTRPDGGAANECDPKEQDCPRGQKCTAWANDGGGFWNANRCIEIGGTGVAGEPCQVEGSGVSGVDDCDLGHICMYANDENMGTCIKFCEGQDACDSGDVCAVYNDGVLPICLTACDPLASACPDGQSCIDTPNQRFICFTDASGEAGADGDPCPPEDGENSCDPGQWCGPGSSGCTDVNCCTPYCDLTEDQCESPDQCVSFFGEGNAPPGLEDVGVCVLP